MTGSLGDQLQSALGHAYQLDRELGGGGMSRVFLTGLLKSPEPVSPVFIALVYTALGDKNDALNWLDSAVVKRSGSVRYLKIEPRLDSLRSEPRFNGLLQRVGLSTQ